MAYNPGQPRHPAGSDQGGEWAPAHGASSGVVSVEDQAERNRKRQQSREINELRAFKEQQERAIRIMDHLNTAKILSRPPYNDADKALNARFHKDAAALAAKLNMTPGAVSVESMLANGFTWPGAPADPAERLEMARRVEAGAIFRMAANYEMLPEATKEYIAKHGLELTVKIYDPNDPKDNFILNGEKMQAAGYASGFDGPLKVTLNAFPREDAFENGQAITRLSTPSLFVISHEMGHISMDVSGNVDKARRETEDSLGVRGGEGSFDDVQVSRSVMAEVASEYRKQADTFAAAAIRMDLAGRKGEAADFQRRADEAKADAERTWEGMRELSAVQEELAAQEKRVKAFTRTHYDVMGDLSMAVKAEGGFTEYAEKWNQHPEYGEKGWVRDPVHRGVHESIAEIEEAFFTAYADGRLRSDDPVKEFAAKLAKGEQLAHGQRQMPPPGPPAPRSFPKLAKAWADWRTLMDKGVGGKARAVKLSAAHKETLTRTMRGNRTYKDWEQTLKNAKSRRATLLSEVGLDENAAPR